MPRSFYLKTLGRLSLHASGPDGAEVLANSKPLALLAVLATMPGGSASRDYIAELLWPGAPHSRARRSLRQALFQLSKRAGVELITADDSTLTLDAGLLAVDLWEFDRAMGRSDYEEVLDLCRGSFLATYDRKIEGELAHWVDAQNGRIRVGLEVASSRFVADALQEDDPKRAVKAARRYADANPLNDAAQALLIRTLRALGRDVEALQAYETYRKLLKETLGDEPTEEIEKAVALAREALLAPFGVESVDGGLNGSPDALIAEWLARETRGRSRRDRWLIPSLAGGMAALTVVAAGFWAWSRWADGLAVPGRAVDRVTAVVPLAIGVDEGVAEARIEGGATSVEVPGIPAGPMAHFRVVAPDGSRAAYPVLDDNGVNIALEDLVSGEVARLTTEAQDEYPVHWSPDSHHLLGIEGRPANDNREYFYHLVVYDVESGARRRLSNIPVPFSEPYAAWSPSGTRIAYSGRVGEGCQILVVNFDGSDLRPVTPLWEWASGPAWSPSGDRLAFAAHDAGAPHLYVVGAHGGDLQRLTTTATSDSWPLWVSDRVLAFVSDRGSGNDLWLLDILTDEARRVTARGDLRRTLAYAIPTPASRWVDRLVIQPELSAVTPGQDVQFEVEALNILGESVSYEGLPVRWSVSDSAIGELSESGRLRVRGLGSTRVIVSSGGWRADSLELSSRPLVARDVEPLLFDDWRQGIRSDLWIPFGDPLPVTRPHGGPEGAGVFLNNGDDHYSSGVVSRRSFKLRDGLSVEVWGRMPVVAGQWQTFMVDLLWTTPDGEGTDWKRANESRLLTLDASGARDSIVLHGQGKVSRVAFPPEPGDWHLYGLQVDADGRVRLISDGELKWTSPWALEIDAESAAHVSLRGASLGTEIAHGVVRVYAGPRYVLPEEGRLSAGHR